MSKEFDEWLNIFEFGALGEFAAKIAWNAALNAAMTRIRTEEGLFYNTESIDGLRVARVIIEELKTKE